MVVGFNGVIRLTVSVLSDRIPETRTRTGVSQTLVDDIGISLPSWSSSESVCKRSSCSTGPFTLEAWLSSQWLRDLGLNVTWRMETVVSKPSWLMRCLFLPTSVALQGPCLRGVNLLYTSETDLSAAEQKSVVLSKYM